MIGHISWKRFLRDLHREIRDDHVFNGAAALGFYLTLAIFPALILTMTVIPYLPIERVDEAIMDLLGQALPQAAAELVARVVAEVTAKERGGLLSFSLVATVWAASTGMYAIMQQMNITYDVEEARSFVRGRATAFALSIAFGVLVIGALTLVVLGGIIQDWIGHRFGFSTVLLAFFAGLRWVIIVLALLLGFALIYRFAPNRTQKFVLLTPGSVFGSVLLIAASVGFAFYTRHFGDYDATYGSIGAIIVLMLWLYIAGLVILVGSEINALLEDYRRQTGGGSKFPSGGSSSERTIPQR